jgi:hypothetical protein
VNENFNFKDDYFEDSMDTCSYIEYLEKRLYYESELAKNKRVPIGLRIDGWSYDNCLKLIKKVEAFTQGLTSHLVCTEETLIKVFNSYPKFGIHNIIVNEDTIKKYASEFKLNDKIVVVESNNGKIAGIISL